MVVIFASLLFQNGIQFWFSDKARTALSGAVNVAEVYEHEHRGRIALDVATMGGDMVKLINQYGLDSKNFENEFWYQTAARQLTETAILSINTKNEIQLQIGVNLYDRPLERRFRPEELRSLKAGQV